MQQSVTRNAVTTLANDSAAERRLMLVLFIAAVAIYLPGVWWGVPHATAAERVVPWGSDEIAPLGVAGEVYRVFVDPDPQYNPQYGLLPYLFQAIPIALHLGFLWLTGGLTEFSTQYPFGLRDPVSALAVMTVVARLTNVVFGAGVVLAAFRTGTLLWGRRTGWISGCVVLLMFPMSYYARTSNTDMGALFWTALGLAVLASCLRGGLTDGRAIRLGLCAALATATKDASYAPFLTIALVVVPRHLRDTSRGGLSIRSASRPLWIGALTATIAYLVASGIVFDPERWLLHVRFVTDATAVYLYPATVAGYLGLLRECGRHLIDALSLPVTVAAVVGAVIGFRRSRQDLLLILPALGALVGSILPVHFVNFRYLLVVAYVLALYAGYALSLAVQAEKPRSRRVGVALLIAVLGWSLLRAGDLTAQMILDSRYALGSWLERHLRAGDRVGYYGGNQRLPPLPEGVKTVPMGKFCTLADWRSPDAPEFVAVIPQQDFDEEHEWELPDSIYGQLLAGDLGYELAYRGQTRGLSSRRPVPFVNPPVQLFVKRDRATELLGSTAPGELPSAYLGRIESWLGLARTRPAGLQRNENALLPCGMIH